MYTTIESFTIFIMGCVCGASVGVIIYGFFFEDRKKKKQGAEGVLNSMLLSKYIKQLVHQVIEGIDTHDIELKIWEYTNEAKIVSVGLKITNVVRSIEEREKEG